MIIIINTILNYLLQKNSIKYDLEIDTKFVDKITEEDKIKNPHYKLSDSNIKQFVNKICECKPSWTMPNYIETAVKHIQDTVKDDEVILGLSGGVDSSVAAALIHRAIGDQLTCVFVDNGLLRLNEATQVMKTFHDNLGVKVIHVDASDKFLNDLNSRISRFDYTKNKFI